MTAIACNCWGDFPPGYFDEQVREVVRTNDAIMRLIYPDPDLGDDPPEHPED